MKNDGYESYLESWKAPVHPVSIDELTPLSEHDYNGLSELTIEEEHELEVCLHELEVCLQDIIPLSDVEYINMLAGIEEVQDEMTGNEESISIN